MISSTVVVPFSRSFCACSDIGIYALSLLAASIKRGRVCSFHNTAAQTFLDHHDLKYTDPSAVAGAEAVVAAGSVPVDPPRNIRYFRKLQGFLRRHDLLSAAWTDAAQQTLGNDTAQACRDQIRRYAHIAQTVDGGNGILGMDRGDDQVTGHSGAHGDLCGLAVPDLTNTDDVQGPGAR